MLKLTVALTAALLCVANASAAAPGDPAPVIAAERAFAARAAEVGVTPSFLEYMSDEAIVFAQDPVNARAFYGRRPAGKSPRDGGALLAWWPNFAGVSRSGDLGFTTGPATINGGKPGLFYFTVWRRQADGRWRWVYDGGVDADGSAAPGPGSPPARLALGDKIASNPAKAFAQVKAEEAALAFTAAKDLATAYKCILAEDARVQGSARPPATTPAMVDQELATRARTIDFSLLGGGASAAGDLVWTYGDARWTGARGHYVRVWQHRRGGWKLVFDQIIKVEKG